MAENVDNSGRLHEQDQKNANINVTFKAPTVIPVNIKGKDKNENTMKKPKKTVIVASRYHIQNPAIKISEVKTSQKSPKPDVTAKPAFKIGKSSCKKKESAKSKEMFLLDTSHVTRITSTPSCNQLCSFPSFDATAISSSNSSEDSASLTASSQISTDKIKVSSVKPKTSSRKLNFSTTLPVTSDEKEGTLDNSSENFESMNDIEAKNMYCIYLQSLYLEKVAKENLEKRQSNALDLIGTLQNLLEKEFQDFKQNEDSRKKIEFLSSLDKFLYNMEDIVESEKFAIGEIQNSYDHLIKALIIKVIRNKLGLENMETSQNFDKEGISTILKESTSVLTLINSELETSQIQVLADTLERLRVSAREEIQNFKWCSQVLEDLKNKVLLQKSLALSEE